MNKAKKTASQDNDKAVIVHHGGPLLKDQALQEETVKEPLLTAPELPIELLGNKKPAAKKTDEPAKREDKAVETPAEEDTSHVIPVKRLSIKPLPEATPPEPVVVAEAPPVEAKTESQSQVQPLVDKTNPEPEPAAEPKPEAVPEPEPSAKPAPPEPEPEIATPEQPVKLDIEAETKQQAAHEAAVQKLADSKKYYLPINAVEKRRSKRFVAAGVLLSVLLLLAWTDIALDAGLIEIPGVKPITHFFSN